MDSYTYESLDGEKSGVSGFSGERKARRCLTKHLARHVSQG